MLDDTGFPKYAKRSPGVKRQDSGTLGKIGNCQIGLSVRAERAAGWEIAPALGDCAYGDKIELRARLDTAVSR